MKLLKYVLIGLMGVLLVACESGGKNQKDENSSKDEVGKSIENKQVVSPKKDQKVVKEVSIRGIYKEKPITLTLGKTTFDQVYKTKAFSLHSFSIPNAPKTWKELKGAYDEFRIPNIGRFGYIFLDFDNDVLVRIRLTSIKNLINTSLLENALAIKYNEVPNKTSYEYISGNGVSILFTIGSGTYDYLEYELDTFTKKRIDLIDKNTKEAASFL